MQTKLFMGIFCVCPFVFGQLQSNSVTVTASRSTNLQPDQVVFQVVVSSDLNSTLNDVLTAVQPAGLALANFTGVATVGSTNVITGTGGPNGISLQWSFALPVPLASTKTAVATLTNLQMSVPQSNKNLSAFFSILGTQVSQQLQQSQTCDLAGLISDAQTQAQGLAIAGGRTLGGVLAMSGSTSSVSGSNVVSSPAAILAGINVPQSCSLTVRFALLGV